MSTSSVLKHVKIAVGSKNPAKIAAVSQGFMTAFRLQNNELLLEGFDVDSGVSEQPVGDAETKQGAINRAKCAFEAYIMLHGSPPCYSVGLEGGISTKEINEIMECSAWMVVYNGSSFGSARTASFMLPESVACLVRDGMELGLADDTVFNRINSKEGSGTVGHLTRGVMSRSDYYSHAIVLSLIPFNWTELFP